MKRILITGAAGAIGKVLRTAYKQSISCDCRTSRPWARRRRARSWCAPIDRPPGVRTLVQGVDCVVHLGGIAMEDAWEKILPANIAGCYNVFEAARRAGVKRVIFASSNHAVGFYRRERFIDNTVQPRPDTRYGVSKVFGEALGRLYADKYGLSVACLRIGTFRNPDRPDNARQLLTWISHRDITQLVQRCIDHPNFHFVVVYGVSNNLRNRWDNSNVKFLGYRPEDDSEIYAAEILARGDVENDISAQFHGGFLVPVEFSGDAAKVE